MRSDRILIAFPCVVWSLFAVSTVSCTKERARENSPLRTARQGAPGPAGRMSALRIDFPGRKTMIRMKGIAAALHAHAVALSRFPSVLTFTELDSALVPRFASKLPRLDEWGTELRYIATSDGQVYRLTSAGADKDFEPVEPLPAVLLFRKNLRIAWDIIIQNGEFRAMASWPDDALAREREIEKTMEVLLKLERFVEDFIVRSRRQPEARATWEEIAPIEIAGAAEFHASRFKDVWGNRYRYLSSGIHYRIVSCGPDGRLDTGLAGGPTGDDLMIEAGRIQPLEEDPS